MNNKKAYSPSEKKYYFKVLVIFLIGVAVLVGLDQLSKWLVQINLKIEGNTVEVIPNFFYITLVHNTGSAFGLGQGTVASRVVFILISLIMSGVILAYWIKNNKEFSMFERVIALLMAAGAIGNLIDRILFFPEIVGFNGVIDFLRFYLGGGPGAKESFVNPFATFNVADAFLVVGCILLIIDIIVLCVKRPHKDALEKDPSLSEEEQEEVEIIEEIVEVEEEEESDEENHR
ncbi:MAG: signal peptidase II [Bacilli bacterium]|nr:signal peptidase II [Bacilli bacterium]MDY6430579.1 signal peptidase II [Bacilli bacterium]